MPEQPQRLAELQSHLAKTADEKLRYDDDDDRHREKVLFAENHADEEVNQRHQSAGEVAVEQESGEIEDAEDFVDALSALQRVQVADAGGECARHMPQQVVDVHQNELVVGVYADRSQPVKRGHNQVIRAADDNRRQLMQAQRADVLENRLALLRFRQLLVLLEVRELPVRARPDDSAGEHRHEKLDNQVEDEIPRRHQHNDLQNQAHDADDLVKRLADVCLLVRLIDGVLVGQQV